MYLDTSSSLLFNRSSLSRSCRDQMTSPDSGQRTRLPWAPGLKKQRATQHTDHRNTTHRRALDYAYGYYDSAKLAAHEYDRQCYVKRLQSQNTKGGGASSHVMCPKSKDKTAEGICSPARAVQNADSYKFIAAPTYWGTVGKKPIALPAAKKTTKRFHPRELLDRTSAPCSEGDAVEDMLIDWIMDEPTAETNLIST